MFGLDFIAQFNDGFPKIYKGAYIYLSIVCSTPCTMDCKISTVTSIALIEHNYQTI